MAADKKDELLALIDEKLALFSSTEDSSAEAQAVVEKLEKLRMSTSAMLRESVTKTYFENILHTTPELSAVSLEKAITPLDLSKRKKEADCDVCEICGEVLLGANCTNCGRQVKETTQKSKGKSKDSMASDIEAFPHLLNVFLGRTPAPPEVLSKKDALVKRLKAAGYEIPPPSPSAPPIKIADMRKAFRDLGLATSYAWCCRMRYEITDYRPADFTPEERKLFLKYYVRALEPFSKLISSAPAKGSKKKMTNKWSIQAIMKIILISSPTLRKSHTDFLDSLNLQNQGTETAHCDIWNQLTEEQHWEFE